MIFQFLLIFVVIVAIIGVIFSFFVLFLSSVANIRENSWEFGVLRALGLSVSHEILIADTLPNQH